MRHSGLADWRIKYLVENSFRYVGLYIRWSGAATGNPTPGDTYRSRRMHEIELKRISWSRLGHT